MGRVSDARARLLAAVTELMWESSYSAVTIDRICERAGVRKGSFYYFFESKADLAAQAIASRWQTRKPELDVMFSPATPPLERLTDYFESIYQNQAKLKQAAGRVLGCPYFTLGTEAGALDEKVLQVVQQVLARYVKYFESAIRDAHAEGLIEVADPAASAQCIFSLYEGTLARARIENNLELLRGLSRTALQVLGAAPVATESAKERV